MTLTKHPNFREKNWSLVCKESNRECVSMCTQIIWQKHRRDLQWMKIALCNFLKKFYFFTRDFFFMGGTHLLFLIFIPKTLSEKIRIVAYSITRGRWSIVHVDTVVGLQKSFRHYMPCLQY